MLLKDIHHFFKQVLKIESVDSSHSLFENPDFLSYGANPDEFIRTLIETGAKENLIYLKKEITETEFISLYESSPYPFLFFEVQGSGLTVTAAYQSTKNGEIFRSEKNKLIPTNKEVAEVIIKRVFRSTNGSIPVIVCFPHHAVDDQTTLKAIDLSGSRFKIIEKLLRLLAPERKEILYVLSYALFIGLISLSLPLGVQSLIGFISSGQVVTSSSVLILFILLGVFFSGLMMVFQLEIVEYLQQKLFASTAFAFAYRIPRLRMESILKYNPPELMNRFFDTLTLQKGIPVLLIDLSAALLQVLLGIFLLSLYHPLFIMLGGIMLAALWAVLRLTGPKGMQTALQESEHKYAVANWLEEMARSIVTFKLAGHSTLNMDRTDYHVGNYLRARESHFKVLKVQYYSFIVFKTLITAILLILGVVLVIDRQINLGQFVAAEIVIILIMNSIEKIIQKIDAVYDVLVSIEKITKVTSLPVEEAPVSQLKENDKNALSINIDRLSYAYPDTNQVVLKGISLTIQPSEKICLSGGNGSGKSTLVQLLLGLYDSYHGSIRYNEISLRELDKNTLMNRIGNYVSQDTLFDGSILENITLARQGVTFDDVVWATGITGLSEYIANQPQGYYTRLVGGSSRLPESILHRLILTRNLVERPGLLIIDDFLLGVELSEKMRILEFLLRKENEWTIIIVSNDPAVMAMSERIILMKEGQLIASGTLEELSKKSEEFKSLIQHID